MNLKEIAWAFDKMSNIYDLVSYSMSFGVTIYWRKQLIRHSLNVYNIIKSQNTKKKSLYIGFMQWYRRYCY